MQPLLFVQNRMGKRLTCGCLNVQIHLKTTDLTELNISTLGLGKDATDEFFQLRISEGVLNLEGIHWEHVALVKKRQVSGWCVYRCMNCEMQTHAALVGQTSGAVLVNMNLKSDPTIIDMLANSAEYSTLYRIVLSRPPDNHPVPTRGVLSGKFESLKSTLSDIQQKLNGFLVEEEASMENRIKEYVTAQRSAYAELQSKARRDKNTLISLILSADQDKTADSLSEAMDDLQSDHFSSNQHNNNAVSPTPVKEVEPAVVSKPVRMAASAQQTGFVSKPVKVKETFPSLAERLQAQSVPAMNPLGLASHQDADGDLDFDSAFHDDNSQAFYESDDETEDTDDSETDTRVSTQRDLYSCSVPITVPMWGDRARGSRTSYTVDEDFEMEGEQHAENIAASIKALAKSVHADSSEMFGERPRPRLNTADFGNI